MIKFDAVILTGGPQTDIDQRLPNKNFIELKKLPLFIHVLRALLQVKRIGRIYMVGPAEKINEQLEKYGHTGPAPDKIKVLQETSGAVENIWIAFLDSLREGERGAGLEHRDVKEKAMLLASGDTPLLIPEEVDQFLDRCDTDKYDYFMGMTPSSVLDHYRPKRGKTGISLTYTEFAEGLFRINNLHLVKPLRMEHRQEFQELYNIRHMRKISNIIRCGYGLAKRNIGIRDWLTWGKLTLAISLRKRGMGFISDYLRRTVYMKRVGEVAGNLLGARAHIVVTTLGGSALDIDYPSNVRAIEENYKEWIEHQKKPGG